MSLWNSFRTLVTGVDINAEQARSDALNAQLSDLNTNSDYLTRLSNANQAIVATHLADQISQSNDLAGQVDQAAYAGLQQGAANELGGLSSISKFTNETLASIGGSVLGAIPWWFWFIGLGVLFVYLGGADMLKRKMGRL